MRTTLCNLLEDTRILRTNCVSVFTKHVNIFFKTYQHYELLVLPKFCRRLILGVYLPRDRFSTVKIIAVIEMR